MKEIDIYKMAEFFGTTYTNVKSALKSDYWEEKLEKCYEWNWEQYKDFARNCPVYLDSDILDKWIENLCKGPEDFKKLFNDFPKGHEGKILRVAARFFEK